MGIDGVGRAVGVGRDKVLLQNKNKQAKSYSDFFLIYYLIMSLNLKPEGDCNE